MAGEIVITGLDSSTAESFGRWSSPVSAGSSYWRGSPALGPMLRSQSVIQNAASGPFNIDLGPIGRPLRFEGFWVETSYTAAHTAALAAMDAWSQELCSVDFMGTSYAKAKMLPPPGDGEIVLFVRSSSALLYAVGYTLQFRIFS